MRIFTERPEPLLLGYAAALIAVAALAWLLRGAAAPTMALWCSSTLALACALGAQAIGPARRRWRDLAAGCAVAAAIGAVGVSLSSPSGPGFDFGTQALVSSLLVAAAFVGPRRVSSSTRFIRVLAAAWCAYAAVRWCAALVGVEYLYLRDVFAASEAAAASLLAGLGSLRTLERSGEPKVGGATAEARIVRTASFILGAALLCTAAVAFFELRRQIEHDKGDLLAAELVHQVSVLETEIRTAKQVSSTLAGQRNLKDALATLHRSDDGSPARQVAESALQRLVHALTTGDSGALLALDASGREAATVGRATDVPGIIVNLPTPGVQLLWSQGYVLRTSAPVESGGEIVGHLISEQMLREGQRMLGAVNSLGTTGEIELCSRQGEQVVCFPSRFAAAGRSQPLAQALHTPSARSVSGDSGLMWATDYRGKQVLAAVLPVPELGLGLVAKRDAEEVLMPVRRLAEWGLPLLAAIVFASHALLHRRIGPMARAIVRAQREAQRHAEKWTALNEAALDGFLMLRPQASETGSLQWNVVELNPACQRMLNWQRGHRITPDDRSDAAAAGFCSQCEQSLKQGQPMTFETELAPAGAAKQWVHVNVVPYRGGLALTIKDLTQRRIAELALAEARERLQSVADNMPALVAYVDHQMVYRFANQAHRTMLGTDSDDIVGRHLRDVVGPSFYEDIHDQVRMALAGEAATFERVLARNESVRHLEISLVPHRSPRGRTQGLYVMCVDVTTQRRAEQAARDSEHRLQSITDQMPAMIAFIDQRQVFRFNNRTCEQWFGRPLSRLTGRSLAEILGPQAYAVNARALESAAELGKQVTVADSSPAYGPHAFVEITYIPQYDEANVLGGFCMLGRDVTHIKARENQLVQAAQHDALTGLPNRAAFHERLGIALQQLADTGRRFSVAYVDLDYFKKVNDSFGHAAGDALLKDFAQRVVSVLRRRDMVARLGGDEFALILDELDQAQAAEVVAKNLYRRFEQALEWQGHALNISASIGLALARRDDTPEQILARADEALYAAKARGRNNCVVA